MARPFRGRYEIKGGTWRDIAVGLCHILHTPLSDILKLTPAEALAWYEACVRFQKPPEDE